MASSPDLYSHSEMGATPLILIAALVAGEGDFPTPACSLVAGWGQKGPERTFDPETLFDYMNGSAEGYHAYGFVLMKGVTCVNEAGDQLVIDVSELEDADHAWGIFVAHRDFRSPTEPIGSAGQVLPRRASFARGPYYAEIAASPAGDHTEALRAFTEALEARIPGRAAPPREVDWFPETGLESGSVRLVPQSVLGIRDLRRGYMARYAVGRAFVVSEESARQAAATLEMLRERFGETAVVSGIADEAFAATDDALDGLLIFRKGRRVAGLSNLAEPAEGTELARRLADTLP
jgi:hypothetical protein